MKKGHIEKKLTFHTQTKTAHELTKIELDSLGSAAAQKNESGAAHAQ